MTKIFASVAALALMTGSALAASTFSGTVRSYDQNARTIVLEDGSSASIPLRVAIPADLAAGSYVKVQINSKTGAATTVFTDTILAR